MAAPDKKNNASPQPLQQVLKKPDVPNNELLAKHMTERGGFLAPLGKLLGHLLQDPLLKQTMQSNTAPDKEKFN